MLKSGGNPSEHLLLSVLAVNVLPSMPQSPGRIPEFSDSSLAVFFFPVCGLSGENAGHQKANKKSLGLHPFLFPN